MKVLQGQQFCRAPLPILMLSSFDGALLDPFRFVLLCAAGWINQQQQHAINYLREENRVLRAQIGNRRLRFNDDERRRLAAKAKLLGRKLVTEIARRQSPQRFARCGVTDGFLPEAFRFDETSNTFICPEGKVLRSRQAEERPGRTMIRYQASITDCKACPQRHRGPLVFDQSYFVSSIPIGTGEQECDAA